MAASTTPAYADMVKSVCKTKDELRLKILAIMINIEKIIEKNRHQLTKEDVKFFNDNIPKIKRPDWFNNGKYVLVTSTKTIYKNYPEGRLAFSSQDEIDNFESMIKEVTRIESDIRRVTELFVEEMKKTGIFGSNIFDICNSCKKSDDPQNCNHHK